MKRIAYATFIVYWFVVLVHTEQYDFGSYLYNYDNFQEFFPQGKVDAFNLHQYKDLQECFHDEYTGTNIGGAWQMWSPSKNCTEKEFYGNKATITTTYYCHGSDDYKFYLNFPTCGGAQTTLCSKNGPGDEGWTYNRTFNLTTCPVNAATFTMQVCSWDEEGAITIFRGFDEIRVDITEAT